MGELAAAMWIPRNPNPEDGGNKIYISCTGVKHESSSDHDIEILFPTGDDITTVPDGESPVPVFGGAILKITAPQNVDSSKNPDEIALILGAIRDGGLQKALDSVADPPEPDDEGDEESIPIPNFDTALDLKMGLAQGLVAYAKSNAGIVNKFKGLESFRLYLSTNTPNADLDSISEDSAHEPLVNRCIEFTYVPVEVLAGKKGSVAAMFGEKIPNSYTMSGLTYGEMAGMSGGVLPATSVSAIKAALSESEGADNVSNALDALGGSLDILAMLAALFNIDMFPLDLEAIIKELAGEALASVLAEIPIEFAEFLKQDERLTDAIVDALEDAQIRELIMEFFPIQTVGVKTILGGSGDPPKVGFYTIWKDDLYLKMPDLSGIDSAGFVDEQLTYFDEVDGEVEQTRIFFLEFCINDTVKRKGFWPQAPPTFELKEFEAAFPDSKDIEIRVDGYLDNAVAFYLSPMVDPAVKVSATGFDSHKEEGIELLTAPLLTKFIFDADREDSPFDNHKEYVYDSIKSAINAGGADAVSMGNIFEIDVEEDGDGGYEVGLTAQSTGPSAADTLVNNANVLMMSSALARIAGSESTADGMKATAMGMYAAAQAMKAGTSDLTKIDVLDIGFPLSTAGLNSIDGSIPDELEYFLGEKGRPEVILSKLSGPPTVAQSKNDNLFYNPSKVGTSPIMAGFRPKIVGDHQIPQELWIPSSSIEEDGDEWVVTFPADSINSRFIKRTVNFSVYAVDNLGQITRAPNAVFTIVGDPPSVDEVSPSGCKGGIQVKDTDVLTLRIEGSNLGSAKSVTFTDLSGTMVPVTLSKEQADELKTYLFSAQDEYVQIVAIKTSSSDGTNATFNFGAGTAYNIVVQTADGNSEEELTYYVSGADTKSSDLPLCHGGQALIKYDTVYPRRFKGAAFGCPIFTDGTNHAILQINAKKAIFSGDYNLFAYLAIAEDALDEDKKKMLRQFTLPPDEEVGGKKMMLKAKLKDPGSEELVSVFIAKNIMYEFGSSDFQKGLMGSKTATLNFPGTKYAAANFSSLIGIDKAYFVIMNSKIEAFGYSDGDELQDLTYGTFKVEGNEYAKAFVPATKTLGLLVTAPGDSSTSVPTRMSTLDPAVLSQPITKDFINLHFGPGKFEQQQPSLGGETRRLGVVFAGAPQTAKLKKQYKFLLGDKDINKDMSAKIVPLPGTDHYIAIFNDLRHSTSEFLPVMIETKDKNYGISYKGLDIGQRITFGVVANPEFDEDGNLKWPPKELLYDTTTLGDQSSDPLVIGDSIKSALNDAPTFTIPARVNADVETTAIAFASPETLTLFGTASYAEVAGWIPERSAVTIEESAIPPTNYHSDADELVVWGSVRFTKEIPTLGVNQAMITKVTIDGQEFDWPDDIDEIKKMKMDLSSGIKAHYVYGNEHSEILFNGQAGTKISSGRLGAGHWQQVKPSQMTAMAYSSMSDEDIGCMDITCSNTNQGSNRGAAGSWHNRIAYYRDVDLFPNIKGITPNFPDFTPIAPLTFLPLKLELPAVPPDLMKSFCNFSFHLTAELKIHLEQFYILCIPIQVLLCIIDVICSLLNPFKMIMAIIRLFECLFDLLLLLPQISIPVMFLNLMLHLLELLECIIRKILFLILAINALVVAVNNALPRNEDNEIDFTNIKYVDWDAIVALEATIAEYLMDMEADLDFLGPIMSILGLFLQLLQLLFRFPCRINPSGGDYICGIDGTMLAGLIIGKAIPAEGNIDTDYLLPVVQPYSAGGVITYAPSWPDGLKKIEEGQQIGVLASDGTFLTDLEEIDDRTFRTDGTGAVADGTFTVSYTKTTSPFSIFTSDPKKLTFHISDRSDPWFIIRRTCYVDESRPADFPFMLFDSSNDEALVTKKNGNFISPHDGEKFLTINGDKASVKPLTVDFEWQEVEINSDGEAELVTKSATKTFDDVPRMVMLDDMANVYFIAEDGISFDGDGFVENITARIINADVAQKHAYSKEDVLNTDDCPEDEFGEPDIPIIDNCTYQETTLGFPQLYFFDMRQIEDELNELCLPSSVLPEIIPSDEDNEDLIDEIETVNDCLEEFIRQVKEQKKTILDAISAGAIAIETDRGSPIPLIPKFDIDVFTLSAETLKECIEEAVGNVCKFAVNPLSSSFKVLEDEDYTPPGDMYPELGVGEEWYEGSGTEASLFPGPPLTVDEVEDWEDEHSPGMRLLGANEYAAGIGDNAIVKIGDVATIQIIPRDVHSAAINELADLTEKINIEIMSDGTGTADLATYTNDAGNTVLINKLGEEYRTELTASTPGVVKLRASVCNKTIKALVNAPIADELDASTGPMVDCVEDAGDDSEGIAPSLGSVTKIDRVISVVFVAATVATLGEGDDASLAKPKAQTFGTSLEN